MRQLEERHPQLRARTERALATSLDGETQLDLLSVAKASQAISGQIVLDELIDTLMRIVLENAGAQTGCLLLAREDELALAADANVAQQTVRVRLHPGSPPPASALPASMLNYVRRSREPVLLMDAAGPHPFSADPYFAQHHPKSVLCLPILRQAALIGVLYLENNLATHAFTPGPGQGAGTAGEPGRHLAGKRPALYRSCKRTRKRASGSWSNPTSSASFSLICTAASATPTTLLAHGRVSRARICGPEKCNGPSHAGGIPRPR